MGRVLGIDPGTERIGLSLSDARRMVATPHSVVDARVAEAAIEAIVAVVRQEGIEEIVVGLPLGLDGRAGRAAQAAEEFAGRLRGAAGVPVRLWDERLTTVEAERSMVGLGARRRLRRRELDRVAATLLLQSYLDSGKGSL